MSTETTHATPSTKKSGAKKSGAKSAKTAAEPRARSMSHTAGTAALASLEKTSAPSTVKALAKKLANDQTLKKTELTTLRDGINAAAISAREDNKPAVAAALSSANRLVRRLARKA